MIYKFTYFSHIQKKKLYLYIYVSFFIFLLIKHHHCNLLIPINPSPPKSPLYVMLKRALAGRIMNSFIVNPIFLCPDK